MILEDLIGNSIDIFLQIYCYYVMIIITIKQESKYWNFRIFAKSSQSKLNICYFLLNLLSVLLTKNSSKSNKSCALTLKNENFFMNIFNNNYENNFLNLKLTTVRLFIVQCSVKEIQTHFIFPLDVILKVSINSIISFEKEKECF